MEAKMDKTRMYMHNAFWHENQVALTFTSDISLIAVGEVPTSNKPIIIDSLNLNMLQEFLGNRFTLSPFSEADTLRSVQKPPLQLSSSNDIPQGQDINLNSQIGKYLFSAGQDQQSTTVISFFHFVENVGMRPSMANSSAEEFSMPKIDDDDDDHNKHRHPGSVPQIVNLINEQLKELNDRKVPIVAAAPVWYCGSTSTPDSPRPQGCPAIPSIPVDADQSCSSSPGRWPFTLTGLSADMQSATGKGVTVFILDTLPELEQVANAAGSAIGNNVLLQDVATNVMPHAHYFQLPVTLDTPGMLQPSTGKDIYGRLVGFNMPDHGLFIAGIVRDLAPGATIECMRVLSDCCVGDLATLTKALEIIHNRMLPQNPDANFAPGDLFNKPVVINMSLVIPTTDKEAKKHGFKPKLTHQLRTHLLKPMQRLTELGAVFTASAGNEGDMREGAMAMNPKGVRPFALYPAAFAYDVLPGPTPRVIPVGAVRSDGSPASYSCYPGIKGIATYGGEVPQPIPPNPPKHGNTPGCVTRAEGIDAVIGIYSSPTYPSLSINDCMPTYPMPNKNAWAYWVGTSFATPIISSILARILELKGVLSFNVDLLVEITNAVSASPITWANLDSSISPTGSEDGRMLWAVQCQSVTQG
jgi:Subtilase family